MNKHIQTLIDFAKWRRGSEIAQPNPTDIGEALDYAIEKLTGDEWIKCSDELPLVIESGVGCQINFESEPVLCFGEFGSIGVCTFDGEGFTLLAYDICGRFKMVTDSITGDVTHWKKLPSKPNKA